MTADRAHDLGGLGGLGDLGDLGDVGDLLDLAGRAAAAGAAVHRAGIGRDLEVGLKSSAADLVTKVDREAERAIVETIRGARPGDAILGEELTEWPGTSGVRWVVDPLDGTRNYVYRYPAFCVSIGVEVGGAPAVGVVHDSAHGVVYTAARGLGARRDGEPIHVTERPLERSLLATGFSYDAGGRRWQAEILVRILPQVHDIRRSGSAALDLCMVATGQVDGFYELGLAPWDVAAGSVIAREAGAEVIVFDLPNTSNLGIVAANPGLARALFEELRAAGAVA